MNNDEVHKWWRGSLWIKTLRHSVGQHVEVRRLEFQSYVTFFGKRILF